jgi:hypothetical protein
MKKIYLKLKQLIKQHGEIGVIIPPQLWHKGRY